MIRLPSYCRNHKGWDFSVLGKRGVWLVRPWQYRKLWSSNSNSKSDLNTNAINLMWMAAHNFIISRWKSIQLGIWRRRLTWLRRHEWLFNSNRSQIFLRQAGRNGRMRTFSFCSYKLRRSLYVGIEPRQLINDWRSWKYICPYSNTNDWTEKRR